ncbi:hypothetical protein BOX15_Mlig019964g1, partial [Macrostomum lignano]
ASSPKISKLANEAADSDRMETDAGNSASPMPLEVAQSDAAAFIGVAPQRLTRRLRDALLREGAVLVDGRLSTKKLESFQRYLESIVDTKIDALDERLICDVLAVSESAELPGFEGVRPHSDEQAVALRRSLSRLEAQAAELRHRRAELRERLQQCAELSNWLRQLRSLALAAPLEDLAKRAAVARDLNRQLIGDTQR